MREVNATADDTRAPHRTPALVHALVVAGTIGFVAVLILSTGRVSPAWMLYLAPIILASLFHDVPGGIVTAAACAASLIIITPTEALEARWPELAVGFAVFIASGIVVGTQAHRQRRHAEALERVSTRDPLTGVRKSEPLITRLAEEMRRSDRYDTEVGLVAVQVEDIAEFTRTFGRYKTDLLLQHLAEIIQLEVRDTDIVGRVGQESFAVVMPHAGPADAASIAERVEAAACAAEFEGDALEPVAHCRVTSASVSYPQDAGSARDLLDLVRRRLVDDREQTQQGGSTTAQTPAAPTLAGERA
ncbi:MAG: diguanylate cyclase [Aeromicrobium sp.]|jgi:diguanylate cyclase (GGDEF)-like protein|nr:diguanylate cyclase [Aeromicrobium sp.]